jgi:hypothetical protein
LRRFWWASVAVVLVVAIGATAQYLRAPRDFVATQELQVAVLVGDQGNQGNQGNQGAPTADAAAQQASVLARDLSSSAALSSPALATAILAGLPSGESARLHASAPAVESALSATHNGMVVTLSAQWPTAKGANELVAAAVAALQQNPALLAQLSPLTFATGAARVQVSAPATPAVHVAAQEAAARDALLTRIAMGLLAALLLPFALAALLQRWRTGWVTWVTGG